MPLTIRLDSEMASALDRLTAVRGVSRSEVVREALAKYLAVEGSPAEETTAYERLAPFIGCADSGGQQLSVRTGEKFRAALQERQRARRSH